MIFMSWKEMFDRWDEFSKMSHAELVEIMGEAWTDIFENMKDKEGCNEFKI